MSERDASLVREFLHRVSARLTRIAVVEGAAGGALLAALLLSLRWSDPLAPVHSALAAVLAMGAGSVVWVLMTRARRANTAMVVERSAPGCHNLVVSAHELMQRPGSAREPMEQLVYKQAAAIVRGLQLPVLFPYHHAAATLGGSAVVVALVVTLQHSTHAAPITAAANARSVVAAVSDIDATVQAPAYTGRASQSLRNPARIEAVAGSRIRLVVHSNATAVALETLEGKQPMVAGGNGTFTGEVPALADGFIAVEPTGNGGAGTRRLIGVSVSPDRAPRVRLTAPGKDMMYPDGNRTLPVVAEADDDIALGTLKLRYTKVSGSGERFTFTEGEVPLQITRSAATNWKARAQWNLAPLALEGGDMVVYRAVATDRRPGAPGSESDSYIAEVRMVGSDAAAGFAIDPDQERYALSQQMIIVKTERLLAKRSSLDAEAFASEASEIAVEQRRVRAEFVFMMGGELEDAPLVDADMTTLNEEAEAEGESDILDGRGANAGRIALMRAVRAMSGAATLLNEINVAEALTRERSALTDLERAFSHTRIILRALSVQERLDLSRRMTGPLLEAARNVYPLPVAEHSERVAALRGALASIASLLGTPSSGPNASASASELAERVLRVDPSSKPLQAIALTLNDAAAAYGKSRAPDAVRSLERAAIALTGVLRDDVLVAPQEHRPFTQERLSGALADALRSGRGGR